MDVSNSPPHFQVADSAVCKGTSASHVTLQMTFDLKDKVELTKQSPVGLSVCAETSQPQTVTLGWVSVLETLDYHDNMFSEFHEPF
jgi:hypothetical protein